MLAKQFVLPRRHDKARRVQCSSGPVLPFTLHAHLLSSCTARTQHAAYCMLHTVCSTRLCLHCFAPLFCPPPLATCRLRAIFNPLALSDLVCWILPTLDDVTCAPKRLSKAPVNLDLEFTNYQLLLSNALKWSSGVKATDRRKRREKNERVTGWNILIAN